MAEIVDQPEYRRNLLDRALKNELPPALEAMLWHYAKGRPDKPVHDQTLHIRWLSDDDLDTDDGGPRQYLSRTLLKHRFG